MRIDQARIAVSGSGGFVGSILVRRLKDLGAQVVGIDRRNNLDMRNFEQLESVGSFDIFVHLAAKTFVPESFEKPRDYYFANVIGTLNALELCRLRNARFVYASSYVYGVPLYLPIDESHPVRGFNPYSRSKILGEQVCEGYHHDHGVKITIFRPFNIYGPNQDSKFLIPNIIKQAEHGKVFLKDPYPRRDFIYIDDVIEAYVKGIQHESDLLEVFNIGWGKSFAVKEIVNEVLKNFHDEIQVIYTGEERRCEIPDTVAEITRAREVLGWVPAVSLSNGIESCVRNYRSNVNSN